MATPMPRQGATRSITTTLPILAMTTPSWKQPNSAPLQLQQGQRFAWWGLISALLAALGAGLCCAGPLLYLLFGLSATGLGLWAAPEWLQRAEAHTSELQPRGRHVGRT